MEILNKEVIVKVMVWAINNDYFGFNGHCEERNGKYYSTIEGNEYVETERQLLKQWKKVKYNDKIEILNDYVEDTLDRN